MFGAELMIMLFSFSFLFYTANTTPYFSNSDQNMFSSGEPANIRHVVPKITYAISTVHGSNHEKCCVFLPQPRDAMYLDCLQNLHSSDRLLQAGFGSSASSLQSTPQLADELKERELTPAWSYSNLCVKGTHAKSDGAIRTTDWRWLAGLQPLGSRQRFNGRSSINGMFFKIVLCAGWTEVPSLHANRFQQVNTYLLEMWKWGWRLDISDHGTSLKTWFQRSSNLRWPTQCCGKISQHVS